MHLLKLQLLILLLIITGYVSATEKAPPAICNGYERFWVKDDNGCKHAMFSRIGSRFTWTGDCENGYASGYGVATIYKYMRSIKKDAVYERYTGTKVKGIEHGQATYLWSFADHKYVGGFVDGRKEGKAEHTWFYRNKKDSYSYKGEYQCGYKFGHGIERSRDGVVSKVYNPSRNTILTIAKTEGNGSHSHAGRSHTHPLPKQGVRHRHGNSAYGSSNHNGSTSYAKNSIDLYHSDCHGVSERVKNLLEENTYNQLIYGRLRFARDAKDTISDCNHPLALQATNDINNFVKIGSEVRDSTNDTLTDLASDNIAKAREEERVFTGGNILNALGKLLDDSTQTSRADGAVKRHGKSIKALMDARL